MTPVRPATAPPGAQVLPWPAQAERRDALRAAGVPRLLVLAQGTVPPPVEDDLEDWVWLPADERDVFARLRRLAARGRGHDRPWALDVGADGWVRVGAHRLHLPPTEAALLGLLAAPVEHLRTRDELARAAWGDVPHRRRSLDSRILVLRRRLAPYGLVVPAVRGRGFVLSRVGRGPDAVEGGTP